ATGETASLHEIPVTVSDRLRYFNLTCAVRRDRDGIINGIMILGSEVTDQVLGRESSALQKRALELALNDAPITDVLADLARTIELQGGPNIIASILLADANGERLLHGAAPRLSEDYN